MGDQPDNEEQPLPVKQLKVLKVGSRKSELALIQTRCIVKELGAKYPDITCEIETMDTIGDQILDKALPKIGEKSLFTKDLEIALEMKRVDFVVHSLKDLPTTLPGGMAIGTIFKRDDCRDAVIFHPKHKNMKLADLPEGSVIGTSSLRRIAQLKRKYPHLRFESVRGNLNTRLRKLEEGSTYDALVLAAAGIHRMNWSHKIGQDLSKDECLYAVGQGALGVEIRADDADLIPLVASLSDIGTLICCAAERAFLRTLEGGCSVPIGVHCVYSENELTLTGAVLSLDGSECIEDTVKGKISVDKTSCHIFTVSSSGLVVSSNHEEAVIRSEELASALAVNLKRRGADVLLVKARKEIAESQDDLRKPKK